MMGEMNRPSVCLIPMVIMRMAAAVTISSSARRSRPGVCDVWFMDGILQAGWVESGMNHRRRRRRCASTVDARSWDTRRPLLQQRAGGHFHLRRLGQRGGAGGIEPVASGAAREQRVPQRALEMLQAPLHACVRGAENLCGGGERAVTGEGGEETDVFPVEGGERARCIHGA